MKSEVGKKVNKFYEKFSFPGYDNIDSVASLQKKAESGIFASLLDQSLPLGGRFMDIGCGTGQLPIYLTLRGRKVIGADLNSLKKGQGFKKKFEIENVSFVRMNLFEPCFRGNTFSYVFSLGVLHHTENCKNAFKSVATLVKSGGFLIVGLYNKYGRIFTSIRRLIFHVTGGRFRSLDYFLRRKSIDREKREVWFQDQYRHPHETAHTIDELLCWFKECGFEYVNSIPKINFSEDLKTNENLFSKCREGTALEHFLTQIKWIFSEQREGGFYIIIGKKI